MYILRVSFRPLCGNTVDGSVSSVFFNVYGVLWHHACILEYFYPGRRVFDWLEEDGAVYGPSSPHPKKEPMKCVRSF